MSSVPTQHKEIVYWTGVRFNEIEWAEKLSPTELANQGYDPLAMAWWVSLRKGDLHWSGIVVAPPYDPRRPPLARIEDLLNNTRDCSHCKGSGKVPND